MSFFGSSTKKEAVVSHQSILQLTRGHIDDMVMALVSHAKQSEKKACDAIRDALVDIGRHQPNLVLSSCHEQLRNKKITQGHRVILLIIINRVVEIRRDKIDPLVATGLITLCLSDMLATKEVVPAWQMAASNNLVSLAQRFPDQVLDALFDRFPPGTVPHYFVIKTLGSLFQQHPVSTVPRLKTCLARILPILSSVHQLNMQWVIATAIGQFCDAAMHYVANVDTASQSVTIDGFSSDVFPVYEIFMSKWIRAKDPKVVVAVVHTVGYIVAMLPLSQFEEIVPKVIPPYLQQYKKLKGSQTLQITQGLFQIINKALVEESYCLQPLLQPILDVIHVRVCAPIDQTDSNSMKNHNEMLRCIEYLTRGYIDSVLGYLLSKLDPQKKENTRNLRIGTLEIFKHLITRMAGSLVERKSLFVAGIRPLLKTEGDFTVKRYMGQVIISMAQHDYLSLEGGEDILEWVALHSATSQASIDAWSASKAAQKPDAVSPKDLQQTCDDLLTLATTTIPEMIPVLWPFLLELLVPKEYTDAVAVVSRCIAHLGNKKREEGAADFKIDFDRAVNLPKPQAIITRFLVLLNEPERRPGYGASILKALKAISSVLHPSVTPMWDSALPRLLKYVEASDAFRQDTWEDLVLRLLSETIKLVNDPQWTRDLGQYYCDQLPLYDGEPFLKRCCLKHLGLVLQKLTEKRFIRETLALLFDHTSHEEPLEREGCAQAFGYCSTSHLDITLDRLSSKLNEEAPKQQEKKGFLGGLFSSAPKVDVERRNTIYLCFGYVAAYAPVAVIPSRVEVQILTPLKPLWRTASSQATKLTIIKTIDLMGKALHPSRLTNPYVLGSRDELIELLLDFIAPIDPKSKSKTVSEKLLAGVSPEMRQQGLISLATLALLPPRISTQAQTSIIERSRHMFDIKARDPDADPKKGASTPALTPEEESKMLKELFQKIGIMYAAMLFMNTTAEALGALLKSVEGFTQSADPDHRERSCRLIAYLLIKFIDYKGTTEGREVASESADRFPDLGHFLGLMIPRCCDPVLGVRVAAVQCIEQLMVLDNILRVCFQDKTAVVSDIQQPDDLLPLIDIKERIDTNVLNEQFQLVHDISAVLCKLIPRDDLADLIIKALPGLNDVELSSASGVCVYLNALTSTRGAELTDSIPVLVEGLTNSLSSITHAKTQNGTLHALKNLATHNLIPVVDELLKCPTMPHPDYIVKAFQGIAKDGQLVIQMIAHLADITNNTQLYQDRKDGRITNNRVLGATCALTDIFGEASVLDVVRARYAPIIGSLLMRFGTSTSQKEEAQNSTPGNKKKQQQGPSLSDSRAPAFIVETFRAYTTLASELQIEEEVERAGGWSLANDEFTYSLVITAIARGICISHPEHMVSLVKFMLPYLKGNYEGQRIVVAAVFAEMISHCAQHTELLEKLVNTLLSALMDPVVKIMCIRGLSNITSAGEALVNRYSQTILDALLSTIDSSDEIVALESMNGLSRVFVLVEETKVSPVLVNLCNRIRPSMQKDNPLMRAAAFNLFGVLWHFGQNVAKETFYEQIQNNLPLFLLHINDEHNEVRAACKRAMRQLAPLLRAPKLDELFQGVNLNPERTLRYAYFLDEVSKLLGSYYPDRMNYLVMQGVANFKSKWPWLRSNAAEYVGFLLGNLKVDDRKKSQLNVGLVGGSLVELLKDPDLQVRISAANAMALLWSW